MSVAQAMPHSQGWSARLHMGFRPSAGKTVLAKRERHGPLAVQRPFYPEGEVCHVYLLHPPGGVVGGDRLTIEAELQAGSHALVTTPGATKFYRSAGSLAHQQQQLSVSDGASLEWLPQENIFFPGAQASMSTRVDLQGDARLALWETHCLGRPVINEHFDEGSLDAGLQIWRDGQPLLIERLRVDADNRERAALLAAQPVCATGVFSHASMAQRDLLRELCGDADGRFAITLIEDLLLLRYVGDSTEQARKLFVAAWGALRESLLHKPAVAPRIWNT